MEMLRMGRIHPFQYCMGRYIFRKRRSFSTHSLSNYLSAGVSGGTKFKCGHASVKWLSLRVVAHREYEASW